MEEIEYKTMYGIEQDNWWYVGMRKITFDMLSRSYRKDKKSHKKNDLRILDAGCGTGANVKFLQKFGRAEGIDVSETAIKFARKRNIKVTHASIEDIPFKDRTFDLVTSFDVIYHKAVKDDAQALKEMCRVLKPGGRLFIRAAAYDFLYGERDRIVHTARRYTKGKLVRKLRSAGFEIEKISYVNFFIFPLVLVARTFERLRNRKSPESDLKHNPSFAEKSFKRLLFLESWLLSFMSLPFGVSIVCVARKKKG